jgi:SAM-dependent methyltransferase
MLTEFGKMGRHSPQNDSRITKFMDEIDPVRGNESKDLFMQIQKANQSNYGYEWKAFSHEYSGWETVYKDYYVFENDGFFQGKTGLDAGCGMGRFSIVAANRGAEIIGIDLSNAIEPAYEKSKIIPTFHAVQGDIYNLPFKDEYFDFAQTLGVIHITPDPEEALLSIKQTVKSGGKVFIYVYPDFRDENAARYYLLKIVNQLRRITVKIPSHYLYWLLYLMLPVIILFLYAPSWFLWHAGMKKMSTILPYNYEQYRGRPFRDIHMNLFDRFGNPVERRYNRVEMEQWMMRAGFKKYSLWFKDGWTVAALK